MMTDPVQIKDIKQLRQFVSHTLCKQNDFEEGIFQVTESLPAWTEERKTNGRLGNRKKFNFVLRLNRRTI